MQRPQVAVLCVRCNSWERERMDGCWGERALGTRPLRAAQLVRCAELGPPAGCRLPH